ncbi:unnamed protein product [Triticum turgidum subsp. durum]|uniref:Uncharacterized protein n=1 Tax=Triticum turgidum subsp. durum TaxID=4567 RepID=A0A9R0WX29_TRITD|nr:unnamed protein product [Triticum turgidum subsp. durum]
MFAIIDNPSNAVEWALAEMINRPEVMQKAIDELDMVVGKERLVQESDISQLNYLKSCIREAFRMHPYHPFNPPHVAMADTTVAGYTIPKGSHVILSRFGLGRNPKIWVEPLEFRPERHLNHWEEGLSRDLTWYLGNNDVDCKDAAGIHLDEASWRSQYRSPGEQNWPCSS